MKSEIVAVIGGSVVKKVLAASVKLRLIRNQINQNQKVVRVGGLWENLVVRLVEVKGKVLNVITATGVEVQNTTKQDVFTCGKPLTVTSEQRQEVTYKAGSFKEHV